MEIPRVTSKLSTPVSLVSLIRCVRPLNNCPYAHVGLYLFSNGGTFSKLQWWCRTTPRTCIDPLLHEFHNRQKQTVENLLGTPISTHQWTQAKLPTKFGGLGIIAPRTEIGLDIVSLADIAFLAPF